MLRRVRWEWAILRLLITSLRNTSVDGTYSHHNHHREAHEFAPNSQSYERLAVLWNQCNWIANSYNPFLQAAARYYSFPIRSVLDLACGTGTLTRQIAAWAESVVGLDASEAMLQQAREQPTDPRVRYVHGDFASFRLDQTFDAAVCCGDSINYLRTPDDLAGFFERVRDHLVPAGLFVFDTLDHRIFKAMARTRSVVTVGAESCEIYFFYDPKTRVSDARVVIGDVIEQHRRIPVGHKEVYGAARETGLEVVGDYSISRYFTRLVAGRQYYVLRKPTT